MKNNEALKYEQEKLFNSENLQQYDEEGQKYFLSYLLRKGYNLEIKDSAIIFVDISSEDKIRDIIKQYNNEVMRENLKTKMEAIRDITVIGMEDYRKFLEKKMKELEKENTKNKDKRER